MKEFLKTTLLGGALFLLPAGAIVFVLAYAWRLTKKVAEPVSEFLDLDRLGSVAGVGAASVLALLSLLALSFIAGLIARTALGRRVTVWSEQTFLARLPQYQLMKSMADGLAQIERTDNLQPALVNLEEGWQIGYLLEPLDNGWVAVFVPQAPTPMSGNVMYLPAERVRPLRITMVQAMAIVKRMGVGSNAALSGVDFSLPHAAPAGRDRAA